MRFVHFDWASSKTIIVAHHCAVCGRAWALFLSTLWHTPLSQCGERDASKTNKVVDIAKLNLAIEKLNTSTFDGVCDMDPTLFAPLMIEESASHILTAEHEQEQEQAPLSIKLSELIVRM